MMVGKGINNIDVDIPSDAYDTGKNVPTFRAYLIAIVRDSTGKVIKVHKQRSRSPTANFIGLLLPLTWFNYTGNSYTITNVTGGTYSYKPSIGSTSLDIIYPNNIHNYPTYLVMIQVGSGSQSNPSSATKLAAPIANGSNTGQLVYGSVSIPANITVSGSSAYFYISQAYSNQSGATIDITEVGVILSLVTTTVVNTGTGNNYYNCGQVLVWYDVLSSSISVPAGGTLVIYYTFTVNP
jgi:hypothetical protein